MIVHKHKTWIKIESRTVYLRAKKSFVHRTT